MIAYTALARKTTCVFLCVDTDSTIYSLLIIMLIRSLMLLLFLRHHANFLCKEKAPWSASLS